MGKTKNELEGLTKVLFSNELQALSEKAALNNLVPGWINRVGDSDDPIFDIFNEKITPIVGIRIEDDGTVVKLNRASGTLGFHAHSRPWQEMDRTFHLLIACCAQSCRMHIYFEGMIETISIFPKATT